MDHYERKTMMLSAIKAKALGHIDVHKANIEIYLANPVGIGEHSCIVESIEKEIEAIAKYQEKLEVIAKYLERPGPAY